MARAPLARTFSRREIGELLAPNLPVGTRLTKGSHREKMCHNQTFVVSAEAQAGQRALGASVANGFCGPS